MCVFFVYASVCACVCKVECRLKTGCTKGMADLVLQGVSFLKLEQND